MKEAEGQGALMASSNQIKDIKEYEYFKQQKSYFYQDFGSDEQNKVSLNSIMRGVQFELGMINE